MFIKWSQSFRLRGDMNEVHTHFKDPDQSYVVDFCFLQIERCYYFLHSYVETAQRKEPVDGRLVQFLLSNPSNDGGQWDMLVNLIGSCDSTTADKLFRV